MPDLDDILLTLYQNDTKCGIHGAAGWALKRRGRESQLRKIHEQFATGRPEGGREWYVNKAHQTYVALRMPSLLLEKQRPPGGPTEPEHRFAIAATEVTVEQFLFLMFKATTEDLSRNNVTANVTILLQNQVFSAATCSSYFLTVPKFNRDVAPTPSCPMNWVSWHDAAAYCNRLSERDGLNQCYQANKDGTFAFFDDYLTRNGYRLPTVAEWRFASRAGALSPWCFGEADDELLGQYARWAGNSIAKGVRRTSAAGSLKPNDWGLFDMHGNIAEWCQDSAAERKGLNRMSCPRFAVESIAPVNTGLLRANLFSKFPNRLSVTRSDFALFAPCHEKPAFSEVPLEPAADAIVMR